MTSRSRTSNALGVLALVLALAACSAAPAASPAPSAPSRSPSEYTKVMVIVEENEGYGEIIGRPEAPYLNRLASEYGLATAMDAGYPAHCPSLAAYIIMTSGQQSGICDDRDPSAHHLMQDNIFHQVAASGREWRSYAENMPADCSRVNSGDGLYLVRHVPVSYFTSDAAACNHWSVPLGSLSSSQPGSLHEDLRSGHLPAYSMVTPNACNDMHGAGPCGEGLVGIGDSWLATWMPQILASPDYRQGKLVVMITWDEGTSTSNHIPELVISPSTQHISASSPFTHCSNLRTAEEILRLPLLACARTAPSMRPAFHL